MAPTFGRFVALLPSRLYQWSDEVQIGSGTISGLNKLRNFAQGVSRETNLFKNLRLARSHCFITRSNMFFGHFQKELFGCCSGAGASLP